MQRLLKSRTVGAVLPDSGRTRHYVSCNDSFRPLPSAGPSFSGFEALFWGRGNSRLSGLVENLLRLAESSFSNVEVFEECSGGNSRPLHPSGVGGGHFLITK